MIDCPICKERIDADSIYCDQCGEVLMECPKCRTVRKGKFCTSCEQTKLIPRNEEKPTIENPPSAPTSHPEPEINDDVTVRAPQNTIGKNLTFSNNSVGIIISLNTTAQIGRRVGAFKEQFTSLKQISGEHAQICFDSQKGWSVIDLKSMNGTYVNGKRIGSDSYPLQNNDILKLANIDFNVSIK